MSPPLAVFSAPISQGALSMAGFAEALALIDVGVLGGVGMALRAVRLRRVQRGDSRRCLCTGLQQLDEHPDEQG